MLAPPPPIHPHNMLTSLTLFTRTPPPAPINRSSPLPTFTLPVAHLPFPHSSTKLAFIYKNIHHHPLVTIQSHQAAIRNTQSHHIPPSYSRSQPPPPRLSIPMTAPTILHLDILFFFFTLHLHPFLPILNIIMASSSNSARKRRGKEIALDEDNFDAHKFKSPFHEHFFNSNMASKTLIPDTRFNLEEGQYSQIQQQIELRGWKRLGKPKRRINQAIIR
ncbi:hypothetical protein PIB30_050771 [Stylosanthes scabra]|uniref:Uncharacterized protein n=1 Tax=Stylosanthes scabra TaxID=79078 RepID=A0ABU6WFY3_9FABA|nr:hypothetical protein [Stylosanthes scabra]